jgi:MOSC domain-containing protein YiiM
LPLSLLKQHRERQCRNKASVEITVEKGITGDSRGSAKDRQITVLSEPAWQKACDTVDSDLPWTTRRANLLVNGVEFDPDDIGKTTRIGEALLKITRETNPCSLMDQQHQGLKNALTPNWCGGVCCIVTRPGSIQVGRESLIRSDLAWQ